MHVSRPTLSEKDKREIEQGDTHLANATYCISDTGTETAGCTFNVTLANGVRGFRNSTLNTLS